MWVNVTTVSYHFLMVHPRPKFDDTLLFIIWKPGEIDLAIGGQPIGLHQRHHAITRYDCVVHIRVVGEGPVTETEAAVVLAFRVTLYKQWPCWNENTRTHACTANRLRAYQLIVNTMTRTKLGVPIVRNDVRVPNHIAWHSDAVNSRKLGRIPRQEFIFPWLTKMRGIV